MGLESWFNRRNPAREAGRALYGAAVKQARSPVFYASLGVPDTPEGRFEIYSLHVSLLLRRLREQGQPASETAQALFDAFVQSLDDALREMGISDVKVGKRMRKLGQSLYGRLKGFEEAFAALPDRDPLKSLIGRTAFADADPAAAGVLADYAVRAEQVLSGQALTSLEAGAVDWPGVQA